MASVERLYKQFKPDYYQINLDINKEKLTFAGEVFISGDKSGDRNLVLHSKDLNVKTVTVNGTDTEFSIDQKNEQLIIHSTKKGNLKIKISYQGKIAKSLYGIYRSIGRSGETIITTQFESHYARQAFPCIDEPEAKAVFKLSLATDKSDVVISNTLEENCQETGRKKVVSFEDTPKMSTYLLAFVIGPIKSVQTKTDSGVLIRTWATFDQAKNLDFALDVAKRSLEFFEDYFNIDYPLSKCDLVALPDFAAGAMENWGLLTFRETCMLVDKKSTTIEAKQYIAMVVAHELAHQWFGNLVTMRWWDDLWLNEGFASWIEFLAIDKLFPDWHMWSHFLTNEQLAAMRLDSLKNTHPIQTVIKHPDDIRTNFDSISYAKGASVIHMLHGYLGKKDFRKGLTYYLKKHAYSSTETEDLWDALEEASGKPVKQFMSAWTEIPGFPFLDIDLQNDTLCFTQKRFIADGSELSKNPVWPVPLNSNHLKKSVLYDSSEKFKTDDSRKILINTDHSGFYITKYWQRHYPEIASLFSTLEDTGRYGILNDMLALNKADRLEITVLFDFFKNLVNETNVPVWDIFTLAISDARRIMSQEVTEALKPFIRQIIAAQLERLSWDESKNDSYYDKLLRPTILGLASSSDEIEVVKKAKDIFDKAQKLTDIPLHIRLMVLLSVAKRGSAKEYEKVWQFYLKAQAPEDRVNLLNAIYHFRGKDEIDRALMLVKSEHVRLQDVVYCLVFGLSNPKSKQIVWAWIKANWQWLKSSLEQDYTFSRLPINVATVNSKKEFINEYEDFFEPILEPSIELSYKQGLELLKTQIKWRQNYETKLLNWLKSY